MSETIQRRDVLKAFGRVGLTATAGPAARSGGGEEHRELWHVVRAVGPVPEHRRASLVAV